MLGEVAEVITTGQKVLPKRAEELGYRFKFPDLEAALKDVFTERLALPANPGQEHAKAGAGAHH
jgi:hypothetical protein